MTLSELSIHRPVFAWMLMAALIVFGWISFQRMGISQLPDADFPVVGIALTYEGAAPEVMEADVVDVIEDAVMAVQGIQSVSSYSRYGSATIAVEFGLGRDIDAALQEVQTKVAQAQKRLPKEMDPPVITKTNPEDQPIIWLVLSSDRHQPKELMRYVRDQLKDKFSTLDGVGEVLFAGYVDPNLRVWVSNDKLNQYELTVEDVLNTLQNEHSELPAGQIETARQEKDVRTMGEAHGIDEFADIAINTRGAMPNYRPIYLKQVAKVEEGLAEVRRISRFKGQPGVGLGIRKQRGSNAVEVAKLAKKRMAEVRPSLPEGMKLDLNFDTTRFIEDSVHELNFTLVLSALLTALVCWMFLGSWSSTFNVLLAIPTSIIGAFIILHFEGFTLNTFTLLGLSLAIGIVVDDAIMVLENIIRHGEGGKSRVQAALDGSKEITFAAMAATIAIVAIFLPVAFMRGVIGRFFFQFGVTMTAAVLLSLLEALTLTPMRCAEFVEAGGERTTRVGRAVDTFFHRLADAYRRTLAIALSRPKTILAGSIFFFLASLLAMKGVNKEFVPAQDQSIFLVRLQMPADSSLSYSDARIKQAEAFFAGRSEVERYFSAVGGFAGDDVTSGMVFVTMKDKGSRGKSAELGHEPTQQEFMELCRKELGKIGDAKVFIQDLSMRGFTASRGFPIEFSVRGPDWDKLAEYSQEIRKKLEATGLVTDVDTDYLLGKPEVRVYPDRAKASQRGVSVRTISETVNALIGGVVSGKYLMGAHRYDIRVRLEAGERDRAEQIRALFVRNNRGELVRLSDVVRIEERASLQQIARYDRERAVTVFANVKAGESQAKALEAVDRVGKEVLPSGYRVVPKGSSQTFKDAFSDLFFALGLGIVVAYMVLASQFNSFIDPVTVLLALPFSLSGAFIALFISRQSLNIYSFIGLILLMGIVKKNSILLVEFTHQIRDREKKGPLESLLAACPVRLRPILMTSLATVAGAIPSALALGPGAETRVPMAIAVIGGVIISTFLTLYVVPCAYLLFTGLSPAKLWARIRSAPLRKHATAKATLLAIALLLGAAEPSRADDASPNGPLGIRAAVTSAVERNPTTRQAREHAQETDRDVSLAYSLLFPTISATGTASEKKDAASSAGASFGGNTYNLYTAGLQVSQPLFDGGAFISGISLAGTVRAISLADRDIAERDLAVQVIEAFYTIILNQRNLETLKHSEDVQKVLLKTMESRQRIGRSQLLDTLQIKTQLALVAPKIAQAANQIQVSASQLATLLDMPQATRVEVTGNLDPVDWKAVETAIKSKKSTVPETEKAQLQVDQQYSQTHVTLAKHYPQLSATGAWGRSATAKSDLMNDSSTAWSFGVSLTIPLFSGLSSWHERASLASQEAQIEYNRSKVADSVALNQVQTVKNLELSRDTITSSRTAYELAEASLREALKQYKLATINFTQYLTSQQSLLDAELAYDQAKFNYIDALAKYCSGWGYSLDELVRFLDKKEGKS